MRNSRSLSAEEIALLSEQAPDELPEEVESPRPGGAFAALWAIDDSLREVSQASNCGMGILSEDRCFQFAA